MMVNFRALANRGIRDLIPYYPGKNLEEFEKEYAIPSSIKLSSNENPLGASPQVFPTLQTMLNQTHIYPDSNCVEVKQALAAFLKISSQQITIGNGSENILELIIKSYLHQNNNAIISQYTFLTISILLQSYAVKTHLIPAKNWGHDVAGMVKAIDAQTSILFLVNPNNPTGTYINKKSFFQLIESVPKHVLIVIDEAYIDYVMLTDYPDTIKYLSLYPNLIICRTFSKAYGLAALRLGYAISSPEVADVLDRARLPFNVNAFAAKAACAALQDQKHIKKSILFNHQGKQQLEEGFTKMHLNFIPSVGNFISVEVGDAAHLYQCLLYEGVIVRPLKAYDMPRHLRITIGTFAQNERLLAALKKIIC